MLFIHSQHWNHDIFSHFVSLTINTEIFNTQYNVVAVILQYIVLLPVYRDPYHITRLLFSIVLIVYFCLNIKEFLPAESLTLASPSRWKNSTQTAVSTFWWRSWRWWTVNRPPTTFSLSLPRRCSTPECSVHRVCLKQVRGLKTDSFYLQCISEIILMNTGGRN